MIYAFKRTENVILLKLKDVNIIQSLQANNYDVEYFLSIQIKVQLRWKNNYDGNISPKMKSENIIKEIDKGNKSWVLK